MWLRRIIGAGLLLLALGLFAPFPARTVTIKVDLPPAVSPQQANHALNGVTAAGPVIAMGFSVAIAPPAAPESTSGPG